MFNKIARSFSHPWVWGTIALCLAAVAYFWGIEHERIWYDEAYTAVMANYSFADILRLAVYDNHPPLYYLLSHISFLLFGKSVWALRLFSTLGAIGLISLGPGPVRRLFGNKTGFIFSTVALFTPAILTYAHEARMYSLAILAVTSGVLFGFLAMKSGRNYDWVAFGLATLAGAYLHYYALVAAIIMHIYVLIWASTRKKQALKPYLITAGAVILAYLPWAIVMLRQLRNAGKGFWLAPLSFSGFGETFLKPFAYKEIYPAILPSMWIVVGLSLAMFVLALVFSRTKKAAAEWSFSLYLLVIYTGTLLIIVIISLVARPMFYSRYALVILGVFLLMVSQGISLLPGRALSWGVLAVFAALNVFTLKDIYTQYFNYPMQDLAAAMQGEIKPGDLIVTSDSYSMGPALYYFPEAVHYYSNNSVEAQWGQVLIPLAPYLHDDSDRLNLFSEHQSFWYITANTYVPKNIATILKGQTGWQAITPLKTFSQPYSYVNFTIQKFAHTGQEGIAAPNKSSLTLHFTGLKPQGDLLIYLFTSPNFSSSVPFRIDAIAISGEEMAYTLDGVYFDDYLIIAVHDENKNHQPDLDQNGTPTEGFTFVNFEKNLPRGYERYAFDKCMFTFDQAHTTAEVKMFYPPFPWLE